MKLKIFVFLLVLLFSFICTSCADNSTEPDVELSRIIAYCYQPVDGSGLHQIYRISEDGSDNTKLINAEIGLNHHSWSPDGEMLAAVGYIGSGNDTWSIYTFNADGSNLTRLTTSENVWDNDPAWSPDGSKICFTRLYPDQNYREELWMMNSDGTNQHWIGIEGSSIKWSPDGLRLIYFANPNENYDIFTCNEDGFDVQQLTNTTTDELTPMLSPDGSQVVFTHIDENSRYDICTMDTNGQNVQCLTSNLQFGSGSPRWSADGEKIAFHTGKFEAWEIYIMNADGTDIHQVTNLPDGKTAINPDWKPE